MQVQRGSTAQRQAGQQPNQNLGYLHLIQHEVQYVIAASHFKKAGPVFVLNSLILIEIMLLCLFQALIDIFSPEAFKNKRQLPFFFFLAVFSFISLAYIFVNRALFKPSYCYTSVIISILLISVTVLLALGVHYKWIVAVVMTLGELLLNCLYAGTCQSFLLILLIGLQLIFGCLKMDEVLDSSWIFIIFPLIFAVIIQTFLGLDAFLAGISLRCAKKKCTFEAIGLIHKGLTILCFCFAAIALIFRLSFFQDSAILVILCAGLHLLAVLLSFRFKVQIIVYNGNGSVFQQLDEETNLFRKVSKKTAFTRLSSHWFKIQAHKIKNEDFDIYGSSQGKIIQELGEQNHYYEASNCLVCLDKMAEMLWMPCGHLSACKKCGKYLMKRAKFSCVMCQNKCQQIYQFNQNQLKSNTKQCVSSYFYKIEPK